MKKRRNVYLAWLLSFIMMLSASGNVWASDISVDFVSEPAVMEVVDVDEEIILEEDVVDEITESESVPEFEVSVPEEDIVFENEEIENEDEITTEIEEVFEELKMQ